MLIYNDDVLITKALVLILFYHNEYLASHSNASDKQVSDDTSFRPSCSLTEKEIKQECLSVEGPPPACR